MLEVLQSIAALLVTLSILVTIHEFGHYSVARLCGVHVLRFSIGFGKSVYTRRGRVPAPVPVPPEQDVQSRANEPLQGTEFSIAILPLGGYVKMLDEREGFVPDDQLHLAFNRKPVLQRIAIVAAGPIANFLLAIVAYWMLFVVGVTGIVPVLDTPAAESAAARAGLRRNLEIVAVDSVSTSSWSEVNLRLFSRIGDTGSITITAAEFQSAEDMLLNGQVDAGNNAPTRDYVIDVTRWLSDVEAPYPTQALGLALRYPDIPAVIGQVMDGEPAMQAGLQAGDKVLQANGEPIEDWQQWVQLIQQNPREPVSLVVQRKAETRDMTVVPRVMEREGRSVGYIGASRQSIELPPDMQRVVSYPLYSAWLPAVEKTWTVTVFTLDSIKKMIMGAISPKNLSGPITIAQVASATAESGIESFVGFIALLSISLGVLNLLPIPVLDGGHLLYYFIELVTRRPVPERVQLWGLQLGMIIIVSVMLLAFYNDLTRL
ncbi:MAG: regulator of sigma E protease [Candidatus Azotimanducaceae bacterium]|jgi:regulator of sigma E protease